MRTLLIVWCSTTGAARALAEAAETGAIEASGETLAEPPTRPVRTRRLRCDQAGPADLIQADGLIFACPEMLGTMAGRMKDFFDRSYYPALDALAGKPYAVIVTAGSDGQGAIRQIGRIATGWRLREIAPPLLHCTQAQTPEAILAAKAVPDSALHQARELGAGFAGGLALGIW